MLVTKSGPNVGDVVAVKMISGEEVIGKLLEPIRGDGSSDNIVIGKPVALRMQMVAKDQAGITFAPVMMGVEIDDTISIKKIAAAIGPMLANDDIKANYLKATTGLEVPTKSGLIL